MNVAHLVLREIGYRRLNFALGVLSVAIATACLIAQLIVLQKHDLATEQIVAQRQAEVTRKMAALQDDVRKITKNLGFNVLILPKDQNLADLYAQDFAAKYMPEAYVDRLAKSRIATIQHLLPSLQQKTFWPERQRTVIVMGVRGEVPIVHGDAKKPILEPVAPGTIVVGHELHRQLNLKPGDALDLLKRPFKVAKLQPARGTKDDITLWINLGEAQELFDKKGQINGILALDCVCAADSLDKVRAEIGAILPDTQVIEFASQALARAESRQRAAAEARSSIEGEKQSRLALRNQRQSTAAIIVPLVVAAAVLWIGILSLGNVRDRRGEIAVLRAIGVRARQLLALVLSRAALVGLLGAILGIAAGLAVGHQWREAAAAVTIPPASAMKLTGLALVAAPLLAALASWLPALKAASEDPANILGKE